jgi:hypothetical protein
VLRPLRVSTSVTEVRAYLWTTARTVLAGHLQLRFLDGCSVCEVDGAVQIYAPV